MTHADTAARRLTAIGRQVAYAVGGAGAVMAVAVLVLPVAHGTNPQPTDVFRPVSYLVGNQRAAAEYYQYTLAALGSLAVVYATHARRRDLLYVVVATLGVATRGEITVPVHDVTPLYDAWVTFELYRLLPGGRYEATVELPVAVLLLCSVVCVTVGGWLREKETANQTRDSQRQQWDRWRLLGAAAGYTVVAAGVVAAVGWARPLEVSSHPAVSLTERLQTAAGLLLCAAVVAESVHQRSVRLLGLLTLVAAGTGRAALQYDTALSAILLATATLLTISAAASVYADRVAPTGQPPTRTEP